jgi:hypothetical protein
MPAPGLAFMRRALTSPSKQGQQDFRQGNSVNPYPPAAPYHELWEQGYESELNIHQK